MNADHQQRRGSTHANPCRLCAERRRIASVRLKSVKLRTITEPLANSFVCAGLAVLLAAISYGQVNPAAAFDTQTARGVITQVTTLDDPPQSYALYLPSNYSADRRWPMLYAFDPFARGKIAAEDYRAAAEKFGYIVTGSNNAQNGPMGPELEAAKAMWNDTHRRLPIDPKRTYTTGLSGGARLATFLALDCNSCGIAGVIAQGATYPIGEKPPANNHFLYYVTIGDADFNLPEVVALRKKKEEEGAAYKINVFPGTHAWAPPEVTADALAWLDLKAMQAATEKVDPVFVQQQFDAAKAALAQAERRGDAMAEFYALHSLANDFSGLKDVAQFAAQLAQLKNSKAWRAALRNEQHDVEEQASLTATAAGELAQLGSDPQSDSGALDHIASVFADLRKRSHSGGKDQLVSSRAFLQLWIQGLEAGQDAFRNHDFTRAAMYFQLMADADPDKAFPLISLAEAQARAGNKKAALKALEQAKQRGLKDPHALAQDPDLESLTSDPEFQRLTQPGP